MADEKSVLEELKKNAHDSINEIANRCGFSRQKVWRIIKNLEEERTIWGYTAIVNNQKKGLEDLTTPHIACDQPSNSGSLSV